MKRTIATRLTIAALALTALALPGAAQTGVAVVNAAGFQRNFPVSPGSLASAFPTGGAFAGVTQAGATETPLPTTLGGAQVLIDGAAAPLIFVTGANGGQINFQVPSSLTPGRHTVSITAAGGQVASGNLDVIPAAPGLFFNPADIAEPGAILNQDFSVNSPANPAAKGSVIQLFATGQGPVDQPVGDGQPTPAAQISATLDTEAWVGGAQRTVLFSGLAPNFVGLWQINVQLDAADSGSLPIFVKIGGLSSNGVAVYVAE